MDPRYENNQNFDVDQMQADFAAQSAAYNQPMYGDDQASLTSARASFGDMPAMMISGAQSVGHAGAGAIRGAGNMLSAIGRNVMPVSYTPPARVNAGYYGQYVQPTGFFRSMAATMGIQPLPYNVSEYRYGITGAADFGERAGGGLSSAGLVAGGIGASLVGGKVGAAIGGALGAPLGPLGMAVGSGIGYLAGNMMAYSGVTDTYGEAYAQRREMNAFLESSSFRYVGAGSGMTDPRQGRGMSISARKQATDFMRQLDVKDVSMNFEDLSGVMKGATSLGMFAGTSDMDDFKKKFKDIVEGVKVVSKTLSTTLQEGLQVMKDFKSIDIDPSQMGRTMFQADVAGMVSGRTSHEVVNLGLQGAELYRGTGIEMKIGYQSNVMNISAIRAARDAQLLSQEAISQAGGEEALAQRATATGLGFMQSAMGRGYGAAFFHAGAGPAGFDRNAFMSNMAGGKDIAQLAMMSARNLSDPGKLLEYDANQDKYMSEMGKSFGGDTSLMTYNAAMAQAQFLQKNVPGLSMKSAFRLTAMQDLNMTPALADLAIGRIQGGEGEFQKSRDAAAAVENERRVNEAMATRGLGYMYDKAADIGKSWVIDPVVNKFEKLTDNVKEGSIKFYEEKALGVRRQNLKGIDYTSAASLEGYNARVADQFKSGTTLEEAGSSVDLDQGMSRTVKGAVVMGAAVTAAAGMAALSGGTLLPLSAAIVTAAAGSSVLSFAETQGTSMAGAIEDLKSDHPLLSKLMTTKDKPDPGDIVIEKVMTRDGMKYKTTTKGNVNAIQNELKGNLSISEGLRLYKEGKGTVGKKSLMELYGKGELDSGAGYADIAKAMFGKEINKLDAGERAQIVGESKNLSEMGVTAPLETVSKYTESVNKLLPMDKEIHFGDVSQAVESLDKGAADLSKKMGLESAFTTKGRMSKEVYSGLTTARRLTQIAASGVDNEGKPLSPEAVADFRKKASEAQDKAIKDYTIETGTKYEDVYKKFDKFTTAKFDKTTLEGVEAGQYDIMTSQSMSAQSRINRAQEERGRQLFTDVMEGEIKNWTKNEDVLGAQKGLETFLAEGFSGVEKLDKDEREAFQKTTVGKTIYQQEDTFKSLEDLDKKLAVSQDRFGAASAVIDKLDIPKSQKDQLRTLSSDSGVSLAATHAKNLASTLSTTDLTSTAATSGLSGTAESRGNAQGTAAEQATAQLNINLEVLTALRALSAIMGKK